MSRTIYYVASSIDGFIATPEHSLDWLLTREMDDQGPMGYRPFIEKVGAIAMGSATYEWIRSNLPSWDYTVPTWVFTRRDLEGVEGADVRFTHDDVEHVHRLMNETAQDRDVWVMGGGELVGQFTDRGLVDELVVSFAPVALGAGYPVLPRHVELRLLECAANGEFACTRYEVLRSPEQ
ncbi:dihydrofolate reductase family protein [Intrasporangium sp.]|uniref:dihydrofolate reductase family protein n=1 Tax=Intrasporangium sp. TaxID=1925024 RepID=UPI00293A0297|nr:dihydrofolate reductase family protein [Intrasporangium sp.]MDV3223051.1 dihydrofolate reductase family protein [Intrasporangium sp.]